MTRTKTKKKMQNNVEACSRFKPKPKPKFHNDAQGNNGFALGKRRLRDAPSDDDDDEEITSLTSKNRQKRVRLLEKKNLPAAIVVSAPELQIRVAFTFAELCAATDHTPNDADHAQFDRFMAKVHDTVEGFAEEDYIIYWEYGDAQTKYKVTNPSSWRAAMLEMRDGGSFIVEMKPKQEASMLMNSLLSFFFLSFSLFLAVKWYENYLADVTSRRRAVSSSPAGKDRRR